jgi:hypothetical protein
MLPGLDSMRMEVERLAAVIGAPADLLPTYGRTQDFARPHIEFDGANYHFVVVERGNELERLPGDADAVLYRVFESVTHSMSSRAAAGRDRFRERMFAHQLDLMGRLNRDWRARCAAKIDDSLNRAPLVNGA